MELVLRRPEAEMALSDPISEFPINQLKIALHDMEQRAISAESKLSRIQSLVNEQAEDEGLWAVPIPPQLQPISEAYLQQELRRLHAEIEKP
jgi:hypothetical protein